MESGWRDADLPEREVAILTFAEKVAKDASSVRESDLQPLRAVGMDDHGCFDVVAVVALFAFFNTIADGLGIDDEPEWDAP